MGSKVQWGGWGGKSQCLGYPMSSHDAHTVGNGTIVGHSQWGQTQVPFVQLAPSMGAIVPVVTLEGRQNSLEKSRPVNI